MAPRESQSICESCGNFVLTENTGTYNYNDNPGGYGTPNDDFGDTTPYTAAFIPPGANDPVYTLDLLDGTPDPDPDTGYYEWQVTPTNLGMQSIVSGVWTIRITFGTKVTDKHVLSRADLRRKIQDCACQGGKCKAKTAQKLLIDLEAASVHFKCYKNAEAQAMINELYADVKKCGCSCGSGCKGC